MRMIEAEELILLLIAHTRVDKDLIIAMLHQHAAHGPAAHISIIGRISFLPHRLGHYAMHSTAIQLKIPCIYDQSDID